MKRDDYQDAAGGINLAIAVREAHAAAQAVRDRPGYVPTQDYDPLADGDDAAAQAFRSGREKVGARRHPTGLGYEAMWFWACRCGAWSEGMVANSSGRHGSRAGAGGREGTRRMYRAHRQWCPLLLGLRWDGVGWV